MSQPTMKKLASCLLFGAFCVAMIYVFGIVFYNSDATPDTLGVSRRPSTKAKEAI